METYHAKMGRLATPSVLTVLAVLTHGFFACSDTENLRGNAKDAGFRPLIEIRIQSPFYLAGDVKPDANIRIKIHNFDSTRLTLVKAMELVKKDAIIESYPGKKKIMGIWNSDKYGPAVTFTPTSKMSMGDYLIRFPNASKDVRVKPRPYNFFHVGSILRLAEVIIRKDVSVSGKDNINLRFSLPSVTSSISIKAEEEIDSVWKSLSLTNQSQKQADLVQRIDTKKKIRITVSSPLIDGKWTGVSGSGPAIVEFVPDDFLIDTNQVVYYVEPDLKIELPSGKKK